MENTKIEWTATRLPDGTVTPGCTFSPWHGCAKVSAGCKNCYADAQHNFHYSSLKAQQGTCWGINAPRLAVSAAAWAAPLKWNRQAQAAGVRVKVFPSMCDPFEAQSELSRSFAGQTAQVPAGTDKDGQPKTRTVTFVDIAAERLRLLRLIYDTPWLDWLLLTKRPENILSALKEAKIEAMFNAAGAHAPGSGIQGFYNWLRAWVAGSPPANVWLGTSVENQEAADLRIPHLLAAPAAVRFLSCEPLLGPVDLHRAGAFGTFCEVEPYSAAWYGGHADYFVGRQVDWVIVGGESGPHARPMEVAWARNLRYQCTTAPLPNNPVSFFFKQWGGKDKKAAGRELDGYEWNQVPQGKEVARA